nr:hypothetical protein [Klebsiella pneumoniae subsp. pneumoniae]
MEQFRLRGEQLLHQALLWVLRVPSFWISAAIRASSEDKQSAIFVVLHGLVLESPRYKKLPY